jgi:predicted permease
LTIRDLRQMVETMWQDIRHATRSFRRSPGFTVAAILTLALGIGANTAIFSLLDGVLFRPLPLSRPNELYMLYETGTTGVSSLESGSGPATRFSYRAFERFQASRPSGVTIAAMTRVAQYQGRLPGADAYQRVRLQLVSPTFFEVLAVPTLRGRSLSQGDEAQASPVAVVAFDFWKNRLGGSPSAIGQPLLVNNVAFTIVGVSAEGFSGLWADTPADVFIPLALQHAIGYRQNVSASNSRITEPWAPQEGISWLNLVVRLPDRRAVGPLTAALTPAHREGLRLRSEGVLDPGERDGLLARGLALSSADRGFSFLRPRFSTALWALMGLVAAVLAIACINISNLLLARAAGRSREIATRLALGASRWRLVRQVVVESLMLGVVGAAGGLLTGQWIATTVAKMVEQPGFPLDTRVLAFAAAVTVATVFVCSLAPALRATRQTLMQSTRGTTGTSVGRPTRGMRPLLVVQMSFSCVVVIAAALFARTLVNISAVDPGFDRRHLVAVRINPRGFDSNQLGLLQQRLRDEVRSLPGVTSAAVAFCGLVENCRSASDFTFASGGAGDRPVSLQQNTVGIDYFQTVGMRILSGRPFDARDTATTPAVAIINESAARRYFGDRDPVGTQMVSDGDRLEIVGVVSDARVVTVTEAPVPMTFFPIAQAGGEWNVLHVRVTGDPGAVASALRAMVTRVEPRLMIDDLQAVEAFVERNTISQRLVAYFAGGFALLAVLLACVGLYGVLSYSVARRTSEIGVRSALGATPANILRLVIREGMVVAVLGVVIGVFGAASLARTVRTLLFGVSPTDATIYLVVAAGLLLAVLPACVIPARHAARLDPMRALRTE